MPPPMRLTGTSSVDDEAARVARTLDRKEVETESPLRVLLVEDSPLIREQIGRASCRERV